MSSDNIETLIDDKYSLENLPTEILFNIFSYLDEKDLDVLSEISPFFSILINNEELWKNLFKTRYNTLYFPSISKSNKFYNEFYSHKHDINQWKHSRVVKTKYAINPITNRSIQNEQQQNLTKIVFNYPKCACYNDGIITMVQLNNTRKKKARLTYIPCTTPQGCSTMHFTINAAIFGRFDGRVFGKLLNNKSFLQPVLEFNDKHNSCVTAIINSPLDDDINVSGSEDGEIIWWKDTKLIKRIKLSNSIILKIDFYKNWTVVIDESKIYLIDNMESIHSLPLTKLQDEINFNSTTPLKFQFFKMDFGSMSLILATTNHIFIISLNPETYSFNTIKTIVFISPIYDITIDTETCNRKRNIDWVGEDGCFLSVVTMSNQVYLYNIRSPGLIIKPQLLLEFDETVFTTQVSNLILVCAFSGYLNIYDALSGQLIKVVQKTEKYPQLLTISDGKMIIGSGNLIQYLHFINSNHDGSDLDRSGKHSSGVRARSSKWNETMNSELELFNEQQRLDRERIQTNERLISQYGGHIDIGTSGVNGINFTNNRENDDYELQIAIMESEQLQNQSSLTSDELDEDTMRAIEESLRGQSEFDIQQQQQQQQHHQQQQQQQQQDMSNLSDEELIRRVMEESLLISGGEYSQINDINLIDSSTSNSIRLMDQRMNFLEEEDEEQRQLNTALEESRIANDNMTGSTSAVNHNFNSTIRRSNEDDMRTNRNIPNETNDEELDEELRLAIALSLSEMN